MKLIDKRSFFPIVCVIYTLLSLGKIIIEAALQGEFGSYQGNLVFMFGISVVATFILSQHYRFEKLPLLLVAVLQYVILVGLLMLTLWVIGFYEEIHPDGYWQMFWSFTIPYVISAVAYYISLFIEIKKANKLLQDVRGDK